MSAGHTFSRRDLLTSFLGAPLALHACRRSPRRHFDGEIVGGAMEMGHRLRTEAVPATAPTERSTAEVVVVGAGPAGLSAAWRLAQSGVRDVRVIELEPEIGGTSRGGRGPVSAFPWGAHYVPTPTAENPALIQLLAEAGVVERLRPDGSPVIAEEHLVRDLDERLFADGRWHEGLAPPALATPQDHADLARFAERMDALVARRDAEGRRAFALPASHSSRAPDVMALDTETFTAWLDRHGLRGPQLRWLADYACRDDYGLRASETSAWAGLFYFASRVRAPGRAPEEILTFPEGNARLVHTLAARLARAPDTGHLVQDVACDTHGVRIRGVRSGDGRAFEITARHVVVAVPAFIARRIVAPWREHAPRSVSALTYSPWLVANVTLADRPDEHHLPMAWDNVLRDSPSLGYVCATHQTGRDDGPTVLTWYLPLTGPDPRAERQRLAAPSWSEWADVVLSDLALAHPDLPDRVRRLDVFRWGHAMVRPTPGVRSALLDGTAIESVQNRIFFAHTDRSGLALFEEAQDHGLRAADAVLAARAREDVAPSLSPSGAAVST